MFEEARTDAEIWTILETEVFSLIERYNIEKQKKEEALEAAKKPNRKKGRLSKAENVVKAVEAASPGTRAQEIKAKATTKDEATLHALLSSNYAIYCLAALRELRRHFPTSPYTMNVMPAIKRLGPISHVLAASTDLYNELLFLKWKEYGDLHGLVDLMEEMGNQGIEGNEVTLELVKMVHRQRSRPAEEGQKLWWGLSPVKEAWARLSDLAGKVEGEVMAAQVRRATEERELEEALGQRRQNMRREAEKVLEQERQNKERADEGTASEVTLGDKLFKSPSFQNAKV